MTSEPIPLQYWDSPLFISFLTGRDSERVDTLRQLLRDAQSRPPRVTVVVSQFIRAEVPPHPGDDPRHAAIIDDFFQTATTVVRFINVDRRIAGVARDLVAEHRADGLTVPDSIHLATAIVAGADMFFT